MATTAPKKTPRVAVAKKDEKTGEVVLGRGEVLALVPKAFKLTLDDHTEKDYPAGVYPMPKAHANHWWAQNQGVEVKAE